MTFPMSCVDLFLSTHCCEQSYTDNVVQTRGQQAGDQSVVITRAVALRGVTVEGDNVTTTAFL